MGPGMYDGIGKALIVFGVTVFLCGAMIGSCATHFDCAGRLGRAAKESVR